MGNICIGERINDFDTPFLDYGKFIIFLQSVGQVIYVKKLLKVLKAIATHWSIHSAASESVLDCLLDVLEALNQISIDTNESEVRGYENLLMEHKALFFICLIADILYLKVLNTLSQAQLNKVLYQ